MKALIDRPERGCHILPDWNTQSCCPLCHKENDLRVVEALTVCCAVDFWLAYGKIKQGHNWSYSPTYKEVHN